MALLICLIWSIGVGWCVLIFVCSFMCWSIVRMLLVFVSFIMLNDVDYKPFLVLVLYSAHNVKRVRVCVGKRVSGLGLSLSAIGVSSR